MKRLKLRPPLIQRQHFGWLTGSVLLMLAANAPVSAQSVLFNETFTGPTAISQFTSGGNACLTASQNTQQGPIPGCAAGNGAVGTPSFGLPNGGDASGQGTLRLTSNGNFEDGFVLSDAPITSGQGLVITFDLFSYGGGGVEGADGIGFFLIDGSQSPKVPGASGGSFGYAQRTAIPNPAPGIVGGYVGLAFDEYGNFSAGTEGRVGGFGNGQDRVRESVSIRGAGTGGNTGYQYLTGTIPNQLPQTLDSPNAVNRGGVTQRRVRIRLSTTNQLSVDIDFTGTGNTFTEVIPAYNLNTAPGQPPFPNNFKFGFSGSSGAFTNVHEIRNLVITTNPPDLRITKTHVGNFRVGQRGVYTLSVQDAPSAGRTTGPVTVSDNLPPGLTFVSGTGTNWSCSAAGQLVTCTYSGPTVGPGDTLPSITLTVNVSAAASPSTTNTATVSVAPNVGGAPVPTPGAPNPGGSSSAPNVALVGAGPDLRPNKTVTTASGSSTANPGDVLTYTVAISNTGNLPSTGTSFTDSVPANTTYVPNSTTLNGNAVPDLAAQSPLASGIPINNPNGAAGVIDVNQTATVRFQVRVNQPLPAGVTQITNQGAVSSNEVTTPVPTNQVITPIGGLAPNLRLVKRITSIRRGGITTSFNSFVNDPSDPNATAAGFAQLSPVGVFSVGPETTLLSNDEVEYTIYFLSDGSSPQNNVRLCDPVPTGTTFIPDSFGSGQGVLVNQAGTSTPQSDASAFVSPLAPLPAGNVCADPANRNGSVLVNLGNISNTAGSNFGFFRFRVRID